MIRFSQQHYCDGKFPMFRFPNFLWQGAGNPHCLEWVDLFLTLISVLCFGTAWFFVENKVRIAVYFLPVLNIFLYINVPVTVYEIYCTGVFNDVSLGMYWYFSCCVLLVDNIFYFCSGQSGCPTGTCSYLTAILELMELGRTLSQSPSFSSLNLTFTYRYINNYMTF